MREVKRKKFGTMGPIGSNADQNGGKRKAKRSWKGCMIV
jgi:hypothetical protein